MSAAGVAPASTLVDARTERDAAGGRAEGAPLDLHEGIRDPTACEGCKRWPEHLRLVNLSTGELVLGRCRATNLCAYCARLFAIETSEMLMLDAVEDAPALYSRLGMLSPIDYEQQHQQEAIAAQRSGVNGNGLAPIPGLPSGREGSREGQELAAWQFSRLG